MAAAQPLLCAGPDQRPCVGGPRQHGPSSLAAAGIRRDGGVCRRSIAGVCGDVGCTPGCAACIGWAGSLALQAALAQCSFAAGQRGCIGGIAGAVGAPSKMVRRPWSVVPAAWRASNRLLLCAALAVREPLRQHRWPVPVDWAHRPGRAQLLRATRRPWPGVRHCITVSDVWAWHCRHRHDTLHRLLGSGRVPADAGC